MTLPHDHGERQMTVLGGGRFRMGPLIQGLSVWLILLDGFYRGHDVKDHWSPLLISN